MGISAPTMVGSRKNQRERRPGLLPAALAALALLTQLLIPSASLAFDGRETGPTITMCTADGAVTVLAPDSADHDGKGFGGLKCHDCVMTSVATIGAILLLSAPVQYAVRAEIALPGHERPQTRGRAPPRPPSTAPPVFLNV